MCQAKAAFQSNKRRIIGDDDDVAMARDGGGAAEQKGNARSWNRKADRAIAVCNG